MQSETGRITFLSEEERERQAKLYQQFMRRGVAPPMSPVAEEDMTAKLQELAQLHDSGALTDEEFAAAKQKLLGS